MTYIPGTGPQPIFPAAHLTLCPAVCPTAHLETTLTLHTEHVGVGCDRDTYSLASQRKMCGASSAAVELLPAKTNQTPWLDEIKVDEGKEAGPVYEFDGSHGVVVPEELLDHDLGSQFTIATWMRHAEAPRDKHGKEQIICLADDHRKNRHHTSLFVRNCKLVLLLQGTSTARSRLSAWRTTIGKTGITPPSLSGTVNWCCYSDGTTRRRREMFSNRQSGGGPSR